MRFVLPVTVIRPTAVMSWPLFAVYKNEGPPSAAVRAFLDFLEDSCNQVHEDVPAAGKPG